MNSLECSPYLFDTLTRLSAEPTIELHLLQNPSYQPAVVSKVASKIRQVGVLRFASIAFFNCVEYVERKAFYMFSPEIKRHFERKKLPEGMFASTVVVNPVFSRNRVSVTYTKEDLDRIRALDLDLILRGNGTGIYKGEILSAAKNGIISFHHGDNRWNRGGPAGFWEVYLKKAATGFVIQILNEQLDAGEVVFRGEVPTKRSYAENMVNLFRVANPFMASTIIAYAKRGSLPKTLPRAPYSNVLLRTPKFSVTLRYVLRMAFLFFSLILRRKVLRVHLRWSVGFVESDWPEANLAKAKIVPNPPGRFLADPFVATRGDETAIFVEDVNYSSSKGVISAVKVLKNGSYEIVPDVLVEDFHLSFPYVFEYKGDLYMVPETRQAQSIRVYRCTRFPDQWGYVMDLMKDISAVDSMVFEHSGKWWLLTNIGPENSDEQATALYAFTSDCPLSNKWSPHPSNPVEFSAVVGRNGGLLRGDDGEIFRVRQRYAYNSYGAGSSVAKLEQLDESGFEEKTYCEIEPHFIKSLAGTHHMHSDGKFTVFDFVREESLR